MNDLKDKTESSSFLRNLSTNYKYSTLVTLSMRFAKMHNIYKLAKQIAQKNRIPEQKTYSIVALRLALIMRECDVSIRELFEYF
jgi:hypothetical protein